MRTSANSRKKWMRENWAWLPGHDLEEAIVILRDAAVLLSRSPSEDDLDMIHRIDRFLTDSKEA